MDASHCSSRIFFLLFSIISNSPSTTSNSNDLPILLMTSSFSGYNTTNVEPDMQMAVNNLTPFLPEGYRFNTKIVQISKCEVDQTLQLLKGELSLYQLMAIIGCGCPNATRAVAQLSAAGQTNFTIPVVSYSSQSTEFSDTNLYPTLFRTIPTFHAVLDALVEFIEYFNWKRIFLFTQEVGFTYQELNTSLNTSSIQLFKKDFNSKSLSFKNERILLVDAYESSVRELLCEGYINNIYYPTHLWILVDNFIDDNWYTAPDTVCSPTEIQRVLEYSVMIGTNPGNSRSDTSLYVQDAVKGIALAFNELITKNLTNSSLVSQMRELSFSGLSGNIKWNEQDIYRDSTVIISQFRNEFPQPAVIVGIYQYKNFSLINSSASIWPEGVPSDAPIVSIVEFVKVWGFAVSLFICVIGIIWTTICLVFIWKNRDKKVIKLTSPKMNYVILLGSYSVFLSIVFYNIPINDANTLKYICPFQPFLLFTFGYNLCVTVATIKLWRIHYIFKDPKLSRRAPKDWQLLSVVGIHVAFFIIVVGSMIITDAILNPPEITVSEIKINSETGQLQSNDNVDCRTSGSIYILLYYVITMGNVFLMHLVGVVFAFRIRKIKVMVLNEYKYILTYIFSSIGVAAVALIATRFISNDATLSGLVVALSISSVCFLFSSLTFVPMMIALKKDPSGEQLFKLTVGQYPFGKPPPQAACANSVGPTPPRPLMKHKPTHPVNPTLTSNKAKLGPVDPTSDPIYPTPVPTDPTLDSHLDPTIPIDRTSDTGNPASSQLESTPDPTNQISYPSIYPKLIFNPVDCTSKHEAKLDQLTSDRVDPTSDPVDQTLTSDPMDPKLSVA